jgi:hypothetical protein
MIRHATLVDAVLSALLSLATEASRFSFHFSRLQHDRCDSGTTEGMEPAPEWSRKTTGVSDPWTAWYRKLITYKFDGSKYLLYPGRPRIEPNWKP